MTLFVVIGMKGTIKQYCMSMSDKLVEMKGKKMKYYWFIHLYRVSLIKVQFNVKLVWMEISLNKVENVTEVKRMKRDIYLWFIWLNEFIFRFYFTISIFIVYFLSAKSQTTENIFDFDGKANITCEINGKLINRLQHSL